ncbi:MAG TPA: ammonia channel protein, partial [Mesorhizobium sp.]
DSLDAFGVHGVGGIVGALLTGIFADPAINALGANASVATQLYGIAVTIVWTGIATFVILQVVKLLLGGLRPSKQEEIEGLDITQHGEVVP